MNGKAIGSRPGRSGSPADDSSDDEFDPASFQAELDASVHSSRSLVQSWLPSNLGSEWDDAFSAQKGAAGLQGLKDAMRPARLGLGAQPAAAHKQLAEDRKIKHRLLSKDPRALGDEGAVVKLQNGNKDTADASSSDDNEEESRAGAIGKKDKGTSNGTQHKKDYINPFLLPKAKPSTPLKSDVHAAADVGGKALFNAPSPAKPAPIASASPQTAASTSKAAPLVAASAFYGGGGSQEGAGGAQLTKNQRKKERQREKAAALKRQREEESRLEEETEQRKRTKTGDTAFGKRSADGHNELASTNVDATERGLDTSRASSGSNDDDGAEVPSPSRSQADAATAAAGGASSPGKRKKKKKKKASVGAGFGSGTAEGPLLNLG